MPIKIYSEGFTLVEVLLVSLLVTILSVVILPQFIDFSNDAKIAVTKKKMSEIKMAIKGNPDLIANGKYLSLGFEANISSLPESLNDLTSQGSYPPYNVYTKIGWGGPYITTTDSNWKNDEWGTPFQYSKAAKTLTSCGANRICGNSDDLLINL